MNTNTSSNSVSLSTSTTTGLPASAGPIVDAASVDATSCSSLIRDITPSFRCWGHGAAMLTMDFQVDTPSGRHECSVPYDQWPEVWDEVMAAESAHAQIQAILATRAAFLDHLKRSQAASADSLFHTLADIAKHAATSRDGTVSKEDLEEALGHMAAHVIECPDHWTTDLYHPLPEIEAYALHARLTTLSRESRASLADRLHGTLEVAA